MIKRIGSYIKHHFGNNSGFTLIEIMIVVLVISIMGIIVTPRVTSFLGDENKYFNLLTGLMAKTFDDSFLNDRVNYLTIHLYESEFDENETEKDEIFSRKNAISVLQYENGKFTDSPRKSLGPRTFPDSFKFEEVILPSGEKITSGNVLVPFYPQGYSDNIIIHILSNDEDKYSLVLSKHMKEAEVKNDYVTFDENI